MKFDNLQGGQSSPLYLNGMNKSTISNPKNKAFEAYKAKVQSIAEKKAEETYKDKTFGDEYQGVYMSAKILAFLFSCASFCTVCVALYWTLKPMLGELISGAIGFGIATLLEFLKTGVWDKLAKYILKYKAYPMALVGGAILFNLSSVGGSILGAWLLPVVGEQIQAPKAKLIDTDSINQSYLLQLANIDKVIAEQSTNATQTTSNYTKGKINKSITDLSSQKRAIIEQQNKAIERAEEKNAIRTKEQQEQNKKDLQKRSDEISQTQTKCVTVAVLFELFLILCSVFISYYLFRVDIDRTESVTNGTVNVLNTINPATGQPHQAPPVTENVHRTIGFHRTKNVPPQGENKKPVVDATKTVLDHQKYTRICKLDECQKPYTHGHGAQKYCCTKCRKKADRNRRRKNQ